MNNKSGYTLIELVVVAGLLGIVGVVSVGLFLSTLSSGGKSSGLNDIRFSGDYAITQIERTIRNAIRIEGSCTQDMTTISVLDSNEEVITYSNIDSKISSNTGDLISSDIELVGEMDFDCVRVDSGTPETVTLTFSLQKSNTQAGDDEYAQAEFSTTVQLRRY